MILLCLILARPISATLTNFAKYLMKKLETVLRSNLNSPCQDGASSGCGEVPPDDDRSTAAEEKGGKRPSQFHPASNHTPLPFLSTSCQATLFMHHIFRPPPFFHAAYFQGPTVPLGYNQRFFSRDLDHYHTSQRPSAGTNFRRSRSTEWDREGQERRRGAIEFN